MRKKIVAGNWKMNLNKEQSLVLVKGIKEQHLREDVEVILIPPSLFVENVTKNARFGVRVGVQNIYCQDEGAFTGEISIQQARSVGTSVALIGHSERRALFHEHHALLKEKVDAAMRQSFDIIFCCGEPLEVREANEQFDYVRKQLTESLLHITNEELMHRVIVAYEPVWAIGTGVTASSEQAEEMHGEIRSWLMDTHGASVAETIPILYGGSCKPENASELFACANVDGGLIGGASLNAMSFGSIVNSF